MNFYSMERVDSGAGPGPVAKLQLKKRFSGSLFHIFNVLLYPPTSTVQNTTRNQEAERYQQNDSVGKMSKSLQPQSDLLIKRWLAVKGE